MMSRAFDILRRDLSGLQRIVVLSDKKPHFLFKGTPQRMSFVVTEPPFPTPEGLYFVDYAVSVAGGAAELIRSRAPYQQGMQSFPGATPANRVQLVQARVDYRLSYGSERQPQASSGTALGLYPKSASPISCALKSSTPKASSGGTS